MKYPIAIEPGSDTSAWGVVVPDLPGCFSAADSGLDEAIDNAREAIALWLEEAIAQGQRVPAPSSIAELQRSGQFAGWIWAVVEMDPAWMDDTTERINITLPRRILAVLDDKARQAGESRSGYIAHLALRADPQRVSAGT